MTNEKENSRRKDILAMAKSVNQARAKWEKYDISDFSLGDVSREGLLNVALAGALYDMGYRLTGGADVTVIVENGQVVGVYSDNDLIAADVIDLDVQDEDELIQLRLSADKARNTQHSVW